MMDTESLFFLAPILFAFAVLYCAFVEGPKTYQETYQETLAAAVGISEDPKAWLAEKVEGLKDVSPSGIGIIIEREVDEFRNLAGRTRNRQEIMTFGSAIDALEDMKECVRRMREPVKCFQKS